MDQRTVESLLRRLVERVEESERRYGEALEELHSRLDQLSHTTDAARETRSPEDAETFDRLHTQVSSLARRLEQDAGTPLDDFERIGKALSGHSDFASGGFDFKPAGAEEPSPFAPYPPAEPPAASAPDFGFSTPEPTYPAPPAATSAFDSEDRDLDKRLVEMAHRLEHSIGAVMPTVTIEALNARLDEIGGQISQAFEKAPSRTNFEHLEKQISEMSQQLGRAEGQLAKMGSIESQLLNLIARFDEAKAHATPAKVEPAALEEMASKAAIEAARRVAGEGKPSTAERLDAMQRDLVAMSDRSRTSDDRLASTLQAAHESLKRLVEQVERGAPALQPKPRAPFAERSRPAEQGLPPSPPPPPAMANQGPYAQGPYAEMGMEKPPVPIDTMADNGREAKERSLRNRLGAAIPDFQDSEAPPFGRAKRSQLDEEAVDLDAAAPRHSRAGFDAPDDLVAAARRAAQAAAMRAEERTKSRHRATLAGDAAAGSGAPGRRKRSVLIIAAAVLLALSALLLYGRLRSKPEPEVTPPAAEQVVPAPSGSTHGTPAPEGSAPDGGQSDAPERSGAFQPEAEQGPADNAASGTGSGTGFTEIAKSPSRRVAPIAASEPQPKAQPASLKVTEGPELPPGVVFSIEDGALGRETRAMAAPAAAPQAPAAVPASLALPPAELGAPALRQAAASGEAKAQYAIALRYAEGKGTAKNLTEAARWFERAASAGLAPAQYRLGAMYERGLGVGKDLGRARSWYAAAAEKGNVKAMHNLAVSVSGQRGGETDYALAAKWYQKAAAYGLADSQFNLGILAEHGLGVPQNLGEAYKWFALAAASGDKESAKRQALVKVKLDQAGLAEAEKAVKAWKAEDAAPEANEVVEPAEWADASAAPNASLVTRAQALLNKLGYDVGPPDGTLGQRTLTAIKSFQRRNGLEETGEVTIPLVTKLERLTS